MTLRKKHDGNGYEIVAKLKAWDFHLFLHLWKFRSRPLQIDNMKWATRKFVQEPAASANFSSFYLELHERIGYIINRHAE